VADGVAQVQTGPDWEVPAAAAGSFRLDFDHSLGRSVCRPEDFLDSVVCGCADNNFELRSRPCAVARHSPEFVGYGGPEFCSRLGHLWNHMHFADRPDSAGPLNGYVARYL
jgi:hypothetical protein